MNELLGEFQEACYLLKRKWVYVHKRLDDNYYTDRTFEGYMHANLRHLPLDGELSGGSITDAKIIHDEKWNKNQGQIIFFVEIVITWSMLLFLWSM